MSFFLTTNKDEHGRLIAIVTDNHPRGSKPITVLSVEVCSNIEEAKDWFRRVQVERPWETRQ